MPSSEAKDIAKAAGGDRRAQKRLVERHLPGIYALALRMVHRRDIAEEIAQEAFVRAWRALPNWQPRARFSTWLHRVTLNLCYDHFRRKGEIALSETERADRRAVEALEPVDQAPGPAEHLTQKQEADMLNGAIARLPARQRAAITLCALGGMPQKEAADVLETSVDALESLLARAKRALKAQLAGPLQVEARK